jgi:hypothetical protein
MMIIIVFRIKLILSIMQAKTIDNGCGLDIAELKTRKCIKGSYALHNYKVYALLA